MGKVGFQKKDSLCWDCKNACGKCSWSAADPATGELLFQPVPGWTAEEVQRTENTYSSNVVVTYRVIDCPLFERDEKLKSYGELSAHEEKAWLEAIRREYGVKA